MADKVFTMRIDEELLEKVRTSAEKNHRSLAKEIEHILFMNFMELPKTEDSYTSLEVNDLLSRLFELLKEHGSIVGEINDSSNSDKPL